MLFVEPLHHPFAIVFVAFAQHAGVAVFIGLRQLGFADGVDVGPREKLQRRRARHFTGQDKAPGLDKVQPFALTGVQIVRPGSGDICQTGLIGRGQRIQPGAQLPPAGRPLRTLSLQEPGHLSRPAQIILRQHRQVEQPLARIVDNLQIQRGGIFKMAQQGVIRTVAQRETDLAHPARRGWPHGGLAVQLGQPFVVGESGNAKVPLRHALDAEQPLFACGAQQGQAGARVDI